MNTQSKQKHKFNFVDLIIILLVVAMIALAAFIFIFKGATIFTNLTGGKAPKKEIYYAVEVSLLRDELIDKIKPGDKVTDSVKNYDIGTVVGTLSGDGEYIGSAADGHAIAGRYPGYQSLIVIISAQATNTGYEYSINGYKFQPGATVNFSTPNLTASGFCLGLEEVNSDEDKEAFWQSTSSKIYYAEAPASGTDGE